MCTEAVAEKAFTAAFDEFWATLSANGQEAFEAAAVTAAPSFLQKQYHQGAADRGSLWRIARQRILLEHFKCDGAERAG